MKQSIRLAPLAGVTDWPFRALCFEQGCDEAYTEMVSAMGYCYAPRAQATQNLLYRAPSDKKLILQLFGKSRLGHMQYFSGSGHVFFSCNCKKIS